MSNQPTILVKKSDGTSVRVSLDEFKKMKMSSSTHILEPSIVSAPVLKMENDVDNGGLKIEADEIKKKTIEEIEKSKNEKKTALSSEQIPELKKSKSKDKQALEELKDYDVENIETLKEPEDLSLSEIEVVAPKEPTKMNKWESDDHMSLLDEEFHKDIPVLVKDGEHILARTAPVSNVFVNEGKYEVNKNVSQPSSRAQAEGRPVSLPAQAGLGLKRPKTVKSIYLADSINVRPNIKPVASIPSAMLPKPLVQSSPNGLVSKTIIHDVKPPEAWPLQGRKVEKLSVGPVDELFKFTLEDFRRLGANTEDSATKLREKFKYLETDSYLMFMDGVEAWYNSPVYKQYQEIISKSLKNKMAVTEVLSEPRQNNDMKLEEFRAILKIGQSLY